MWHQCSKILGVPRLPPGGSLVTGRADFLARVNGVLVSQDQGKEGNISASDIYKVLIYNILPLKGYCYCK